MRRMSREGLRPNEWRLVLGTGGAYSLRMLGLYMALPILATWAGELGGATHVKVGLAVGAYGLTQAIFQVPFGVLGDIVGRRVVVFLSLIIFAAGSFVVSTATDIDRVILGRLLQGAGAMASTIIALIGDGTREEVRTRAMAVFGVIIGVSFAGGFLVGPQVAARVGVGGVFAAAGVLSLIAALLFQFLVPPRLTRDSIPAAAGGGANAAPSWSWGIARVLLREPSLLVLDAGIGILHASVTGAFVIIPFLLRAHLDDQHLWIAYGPAIAGGLAAMGWASRRAEVAGRARGILNLGALICIAGLVGIALFRSTLAPLAVSLAVFVIGFGMLEPVLAALLTRHTQRASRGTAAGVFNLAQFLGAFLGGVLAGRLMTVGTWAPFVAMAVLFGAWLALLGRLRQLPTQAAGSRPDAVDAAARNQGAASP